MTKDELLAALGALPSTDPVWLVAWIDRVGAHGAIHAEDAYLHLDHADRRRVVTLTVPSGVL